MKKNDLIKAMRRLQDGTERKNRWIRAEEMKPADPEEFVLCIVSGKAGNIEFDNAVQLGEYDPQEDVWMIEGWELYSNLNVTYWMPLPELPLEEDEP